MIDAITVGKNIKNTRKDRGMTQYQLSLITNITTSALSAYENGRQMPGLDSLAKIAIALNTSLDQLYFGRPSEAFLNETEDYGETIVNCFLKMYSLGLITLITNSKDRQEATIYISSCGTELVHLYSSLQDYRRRINYYPDGEAFIQQIKQATINETNENKQIDEMERIARSSQ